MSKHHYHAVIWIDHHEARVFHFSPTDVERLILHPGHPTRHIHHKANSIGSGHASADHDFLEAAAESIADAGAVLIAGPANAKTELVKHIHHGAARQLNAFCTCVKVVFSLLPIPVAAATITIEIPAAIRAYSIAVAPDWSAKKPRSLIMSDSPDIYVRPLHKENRRALA